MSFGDILKLVFYIYRHAVSRSEITANFIS